MKKVQVAILAGFGINADKELAAAFSLAGGSADFVHVEDLRLGKIRLDGYDIVGFPGGFSFGDHLGSGKVLSHIVQKSAKDQIDALLARGGLVLGICNGFQTIAKMGLVPNSQGDWTQEISLIHNAGGCFIDQWVDLVPNPLNPSPWLAGLGRLSMPMRHGEGQVVLAGESVARLVAKHNLVAFTYAQGAPNGSWADAAGLTDLSGQVLGMMPHPECFLSETQRPGGSRGDRRPEALGLFTNAIAWARGVK